jgi:hypothetical protein
MVSFLRAWLLGMWFCMPSLLLLLLCGAICLGEAVATWPKPASGVRLVNAYAWSPAPQSPHPAHGAVLLRMLVLDVIE